MTAFATSPTCLSCVPWWTPFTVQTRTFTDPKYGVLHVPFVYAEWLIYRLHVDQHQGSTRWPGEIDAVTSLLQANPTVSLENLTSRLHA